MILFMATACKHSQTTTKSTAPQSSPAEDKMPFRPPMAKITFGDGKTKFANVVSQSATLVTIRMIPGGEEYSISTKGIILNSNGSYAKGSRVQSVMIKNAGQSIYDKIDQSSFNYGTLGFRFPDGKVQYANALTVQPVFLSITMMHSGFNYQLYFKGGEWKIDIQGGEYRNGTVIRDIFELAQNFKRFC